MNFFENLREYVVPDTRTTLERLIHAENEYRELMGHKDFLVLPNGHNEKEVNIYEANLWNNAELAALLRKAGVRTRNAGHALPSLGLLLRLRQCIENTACETVYEPTALGRNKRDYWLPIFKELVHGAFICFITIVVVHCLYYWSEELHHRCRCVKISEFYSLKCYVLKKCRSYLEEMSYNLVYTVLCGLGLAMANTARKYSTAVRNTLS